jgi:hypothetical protein
MQTLFVDGIANIALIDGVVRVDLVNITRAGNDQADFRPVGVIAMPLQGMLRMHDQLQKAIDRMIQDGVLKRAETPTAPDDAPEES